MIHSMTGYGKAEAPLGRSKLLVELRSVNSKNLDLNLQLPGSIRAMELPLRKTIGNALERGKIDCRIYHETIAEGAGYKLNLPLAGRYYKELKLLKKNLGMEKKIELGNLLLLPDIFIRDSAAQLSAGEEKKIAHALAKAIAGLIKYRRTEGNVLERELLKRIGAIERALVQIKPLDKKRMENVKSKLANAFSSLGPGKGVDENRFEQELIYYIERLDLTEESVRLKAHCAYFRKTMRSEKSAGKKLGFIAQEIGREVNTIGSKANDAEIQRIVVEAKDELEKIKEQLFNVL